MEQGTFLEIDNEEECVDLPYSRVIEGLHRLDQIESPICKLEHIFKCCTKEIQATVDEFWRDYDIPSKKLYIGADELQALIIYIVANMRGCPQLITHINIIENFTPEQISLSNRGYYLTMV